MLQDLKNYRFQILKKMKLIIKTTKKLIKRIKFDNPKNLVIFTIMV